MQIAGFLKNSFIDYPNTISAVVFTRGCNMDCWYCHNKHLLFEQECVKESAVLEYLVKNKDMLEGIVISGGEPTLQKDLGEFISKIKAMGYKIKLDTNGTDVQAIAQLINKKLIDYVAMDIKAPTYKYSQITNTRDDLENIKASIDLLINGALDYEFRTTVSPDLSLADVEEIARLISGSKAYYIQKYRANHMGNKMRELEQGFYIQAKQVAEKYITCVKIRG